MEDHYDNEGDPHGPPKHRLEELPLRPIPVCLIVVVNPVVDYQRAWYQADGDGGKHILNADHVSILKVVEEWKRVLSLPWD